MYFSMLLKNSNLSRYHLAKLIKAKLVIAFFKIILLNFYICVNLLCNSLHLMQVLYISFTVLQLPCMFT